MKVAIAQMMTKITKLKTMTALAWPIIILKLPETNATLITNAAAHHPKQNNRNLMAVLFIRYNVMIEGRLNDLVKEFKIRINHITQVRPIKYLVKC